MKKILCWAVVFGLVLPVLAGCKKVDDIPAGSQLASIDAVKAAHQKARQNY